MEKDNSNHGNDCEKLLQMHDKREFESYTQHSMFTQQQSFMEYFFLNNILYSISATRITKWSPLQH